MVETRDSNKSKLVLVCPRFRNRLVPGVSDYHCPTDDLLFPMRDGIWRFLLPSRREYFKPFVEQYETVRRDEG
ncbi:MAG: hypothetical protein WA996_18465 [Candidatus Promineifilaceae bacterium]